MAMEWTRNLGTLDQMVLIGPSTIRRHRWFLIAMLTAVIVVGIATPAEAHANFVSSVPAASSTFDGEISEVTFTFDAAVDPVTDGWRIIGAIGGPITTSEPTMIDDRVVAITAPVPLPSDDYTATWSIRGSDGHPIDGRVSFTVTGSTPPIPADATFDASTTQGSSGTPLAEAIATLLRWIVYASILVCVGTIAFGSLVFRGSRAENRRLIFFLRRATASSLIATMLAWLAELVVWDGSATALVSPSVWVDLAGTGFGIGTLLRLIGAAMVLTSVTFDAIEPLDDGSFGVRMHGNRLVIAGAIALLISESFIGHTASVAPRFVMAVSDAIHLAAGAIWGTGAALLLATIRRRDRNDTLATHSLTARFSQLATVALVAVTISGAVMAWSILRDLDGLVTSEFGRLLIVKVLLVVAIGIVGLQNRRTIIPALDRGDAASIPKLRRNLSIEAALFIAVLGVTAMLVVASPVG